VCKKCCCVSVSVCVWYIISGYPSVCVCTKSGDTYTIEYYERNIYYKYSHTPSYSSVYLVFNFFKNEHCPIDTDIDTFSFFLLILLLQNCLLFFKHHEPTSLNQTPLSINTTSWIQQCKVTAQRQVIRWKLWCRKC